MQHHNYSLSDLENMIPWEREIYVEMLMDYIKEQNKKQEEQNRAEGRGAEGTEQQPHHGKTETQRKAEAEAEHQENVRKAKEEETIRQAAEFKQIEEE